MKAWEWTALVILAAIVGWAERIVRKAARNTPAQWHPAGSSPRLTRDQQEER